LGKQVFFIRLLEFQSPSLLIFLYYHESQFNGKLHKDPFKHKLIKSLRSWSYKDNILAVNTEKPV